MSKRAKAPPGCYWRGGTLWGRVVSAGKEHRWSLDTDDAKVAKARRAEGRARIIALKHGDARRTFTEVAHAWGEWIVHQVAPSTVTRYAVSLGQLDPWLAGKHLDEVRPALLAEIARERIAGGVTPATAKRDLVALSSVMNFAMDQGWQESNPVPDRLKRIKERRDPIVLPSDVDVEALCRRAPGMLSAMIRAARVTGCRQEELASATWRHLDLRAKTLTIIGKGRKMRTISLEPFEGWRVFAALPAGVGDAPLFWHGKGRRYANVASRFALLAKEVEECVAGFRRFRFHDLRHLHAVELLRAGWSKDDVQKRLGHSSVKVTEQYLAYVDAPRELAKEDAK